MSISEPAANADLVAWDDVPNSLTTSGLLLGNGASRAIWNGFQYDSLYEQAKRISDGKRLTADDMAVFTEFRTTNFEGVLSALSTTRRALNALGKPDDFIAGRYKHIRQALVESVHATHVRHLSIPEDTLTTIVNELKRYEFVYSTNYDLIVYWSVMSAKAKDFKDFFWDSGTGFNLANSDVWGKATKVLYLHGGLHIYVDEQGKTSKLVSGGRDILTQFEESSKIPLFVSEGQSVDKLAAIYRSDYLSFAYSTLMRHGGPMVIFGQGLCDADKHIVDALNKARIAEIVVGIYPTSSQEVRSMKAHYRTCFTNSNLTFFDTTTHPLGQSSLRVHENHFPSVGY